MRWYLVLAAACGAIVFAIVGMAAAKGGAPFHSVVGNLLISANGNFTPTKLPKNEFAPISIDVSGKIRTLDGTHPPAVKEVVIETDKNGTINAKGLAVCTSAKLQAQTTEKARAVCKDALIGEGKTSVEVEFAESRPFIATSKLLAFNGGVKGGKTTILIHAFLTSPVSAAVITTVTISKIHNGRFGTKSVALVPKIAGGSGSVTKFSLTFNRAFKNTPYLFAKCTDGKLEAKATSVFSDGRKLTGSFVRACTPKG